MRIEIQLVLIPEPKEKIRRKSVRAHINVIERIEFDAGVHHRGFHVLLVTRVNDHSAGRQLVPPGHLVGVDHRKELDRR